jgi:acyl carrier protein
LTQSQGVLYIRAIQLMASRTLPARELLEPQLVTLIAERLLETMPGFSATSNLFEHGLDSMAIMQLLLLLEEEYRVSIPEKALTRQNFSSVRHVAQLIHECAAKAA